MLLIMVVMPLMVMAGSESYVIVNIDKTGVAMSVTEATTSKNITKQNAYTEAMWNSFGITNSIIGSYPYIIKDGTDWRDMTPAEVTTVDTKIKDEVTVDAEADVDMDAIFHMVANAIKNNAKTYDEVKDLFTDGVDPKKAKKQKKNK